MNIYQFKGLTIEVFNDNASELNTADNGSDYLKCYFGSNGEQYPVSKHGARVYKEDQVIASCILIASGGATGIHSTSSLLSNDQLLVCCCDTVFCLRLPDLELNWQVKIDPATCFQIFQLQDDYLIHGEIEISRVDKNGNIKWHFSGADIFVSPNGSEEFKLDGNRILLNDFSGNSYILDFAGKVLWTTYK